MDETFYSGSIDVVATTVSVLARRCKESPACFQDYVDQTWELLAMTEQMGFEGERTRVIGTLYPARRQPTPEEVKRINDSLAVMERNQDAAPAASGGAKPAPTAKTSAQDDANASG